MNDQVVDLVLQRKQGYTLMMNVSDLRNQTINASSSHWFALWRYYQGQWHEGISRAANSVPEILMEFANLTPSSNYSLRHDQMVWQNWYQDLNFSYYESYLLADFPITENVTLNLTLTPARNDFPIRVKEVGSPNNISGVTVTLYRYNYSGGFESISNITDGNGIAWFNGLEYDDIWYYNVTKPLYQSKLNQLLSHTHYENSVENNYVELMFIG